MNSTKELKTLTGASGYRSVSASVTFPPLRAILPFIVMACLGIAGSAVQTYYGDNELHVFIGAIWKLCTLLGLPVLMLLVLCLVISAFPAARRRLLKAVPALITPISVYLSIIFPVERFAYEAALPRFEYQKFVHEGADAKCVASAADLGDGKKLAICRKLVFDNRLLVVGDLDEDEIVFDSTDQITLPLQKRSPTWRATAARVKLIDNSAWYGELPKEREVFFSTTPLGNHFYYINLQYWAFDGAE